MRLTPTQVSVIKEEARKLFGPCVEIRLFGSRTDDEARGGDIDLLVVSPEPISDRERKVLHYVARLQIRLGDRPIDVLVLDPTVQRMPIHEAALRTGITL